MSEMDSRTGRSYSKSRYSSDEEEDTHYSRRVRSTVTSYKRKQSSGSTEYDMERSRSRSPAQSSDSTDGEISDDDDDDDEEDNNGEEDDKDEDKEEKEEPKDVDDRTRSKRRHGRERDDDQDQNGRRKHGEEDTNIERGRGRDRRERDHRNDWGRRSRERERNRRREHERNQPRERNAWDGGRWGRDQDRDRRRRYERDEEERGRRHEKRREKDEDDEEEKTMSRKRPRESENNKDEEDTSEQVNQETELPAKKAKPDDTITTRTGGAYIPPARLRMMQASITDKSSQQYQRIAWEALKKSINGLINKVNVSNLINIVQELFHENIVRGRGLLARSIIQAQALSPTFTHVYAALVAVINTKFPQNGELILRRLIISFKKGFKRNNKDVCLSSTRFLAHLVNQQVAHEIIALEILTLLLENPTDDSVEVSVGFLKESGAKLTEVSPRGIHAIFERLRSILHEGQIDKRVQYMIEVMFATRKDGFKAHPSVVEELDLVEEEDQFTHMLTLEDATSAEEMLNVFKHDLEYEATEEKYKVLKKEILEESSSGEESGSGSGSSSGSDSDSDSNEEKEGEEQTIVDQTETNLIALRRTIYLTIQSSLDFEECAHKLLRMELKPGQELELCNMILDCCAQQRTFEKFFGLLAQRFCMIDKKYVGPFESVFREQYESIHRLETNKLRNVGKFFAHLFYSDAIGWQVLENIKLNEDDTTSSSRIFIKILFQELSEYLGLPKLNGRLKDPTLQPHFEGLFPRDNPRNTRFAINFFTSIGLGGLTDELRSHLKTKTKQMVQQQQQQDAIQSSSSSSSSDSSSSDSDSDSSSDSSSSSSSESEEEISKKKGKKAAVKKDRKVPRPRSSSNDKRHKENHRERSLSVDGRAQRRHKQRSVSVEKRDKRNLRQRSGSVDRKGQRNQRQRSLSVDRKDQRNKRQRSISGDRRNHKQRSVSLERREPKHERQRSPSVERRNQRNHRQRSVSVDRKDQRNHRQRSLSVERRDQRNQRQRSVSLDRRDQRNHRQRSLSLDRREQKNQRERSVSVDKRDQRNRRQRSLSVDRRDQRERSLSLERRDQRNRRHQRSESVDRKEQRNIIHVHRSPSGDRRREKQRTRGGYDEARRENNRENRNRQRQASPDFSYDNREHERKTKNRRVSMSPSDKVIMDRNRRGDSVSPPREINSRNHRGRDRDRDPRVNDSVHYEDSWARVNSKKGSRESTGDHREHRQSNNHYNENSPKGRKEHYDSDSDSDRGGLKNRRSAGSDRAKKQNRHSRGRDR